MLNSELLCLDTSRILLSNEIKFHTGTIGSGAIISLALLPWRAQFVFDATKYLNRNGYKIQSSIPTVFQKGMRKSRLTLKLDGNKGTTINMIERELSRSEDDMRAYCSNGSNVSKQSYDLGLFFINDFLLGSTVSQSWESGFSFNEWISKYESQEFTKAYGYYLGREIKRIADVTKVDIAQPFPFIPMQVNYIDTVAKEYYGRSAKGQDKDIRGYRVLFLIARLLTTPRIINTFVPYSSYIELKISVAALHHCYFCLKSLYAERSFSQDFKLTVNLLMKDIERFPISRKQMHSLRNTMFHYGIQGSTSHKLNHDIEFNGLFEALSGLTFNKLIECYRETIDQLWNQFDAIFHCKHDAKTAIPLR